MEVLTSDYYVVHVKYKCLMSITGTDKYMYSKKLVVLEDHSEFFMFEDSNHAPKTLHVIIVQALARYAACNIKHACTDIALLNTYQLISMH